MKIRLAPLSLRRAVPILSTAALLLTACATAPTTPVTPIRTAQTGIRGIMHGGQQPVSGATVQLWAVGTTGEGSAATPLLNPAVTTDANGNFNITSLYTCPSSGTLVYLTGTGGNPGLSSGTNNPALAMMAALGNCGSLGSSTDINMNEVTTIGAVFALAPASEITSYSAIGYDATSGSSLGDIIGNFDLANLYVNTATGTPGGPGLPSGIGVSVAQVNTLADLLAMCVNTNGSNASGTPCTSLFALTGGTSTTDTIAAAIHIARNPTANLTSLLNLVPPSAPFLPQLTAAPSTWTIPVGPVVATPTISPSGGTYTSSQTVTLADTTTNASIHYTLDGSTPTDSSTTYTTPLTVSTTETVNAIASLSGDLDSAIASASFTINTPPNSGIITTIAGNGLNTYSTPGFTNGGFSGDGGQATGAELNDPYYLTADTNGNIYFGDFFNYRIRKVTPTGIISTIAGNGTSGYSGDGFQATSAEIKGPGGVAVDSGGNLYIADTYNSRVRKVTPAGIISTVAGTGTAGYYGDGGQATSAYLKNPYGIAFDGSGNLYIADEGNNRIRMVTPAGTISTFAGNGTGNFYGDGGQAASAELNSPIGVAFDTSGNLYIADSQNQRIRKVTPAGVISTFAGNGTAGTTGDGGQATSAELSNPQAVATDSSGNVYVGPRKITPAGIISTYVGNGTSGFSGDGGQATSAEITGATGVAIDSSGNIYISDYANNRIRKINH